FAPLRPFRIGGLNRTSPLEVPAGFASCLRSLAITQLCFSPSSYPQSPALAVHRRVEGMPQRHAHAGTLLQDRYLFRRSRHGPRRQRWQHRFPDVIADSPPGELAGRWKLVPHSRPVVTAPAQTPRTIRLGSLTTSAQHDDPFLLMIGRLCPHF